MFLTKSYRNFKNNIKIRIYKLYIRICKLRATAVLKLNHLTNIWTLNYGTAKRLIKTINKQSIHTFEIVFTIHYWVKYKKENDNIYKNEHH